MAIAWVGNTVLCELTYIHEPTRIQERTDVQVECSL